MNTQLIYTIHNCVTTNGKDRTVTVNGAKAEEYLSFLKRALGREPANGDYVKSFGITIDSIKRQD